MQSEVGARVSPSYDFWGTGGRTTGGSYQPRFTGSLRERIQDGEKRESSSAQKETVTLRFSSQELQSLPCRSRRKAPILVVNSIRCGSVHSRAIDQCTRSQHRNPHTFRPTSSLHLRAFGRNHTVTLKTSGNRGGSGELTHFLSLTPSMNAGDVVLVMLKGDKRAGK
jgi:hypothetical protein